MANFSSINFANSIVMINIKYRDAFASLEAAFLVEIWEKYNEKTLHREAFKDLIFSLTMTRPLQAGGIGTSLERWACMEKLYLRRLLALHIQIISVSTDIKITLSSRLIMIVKHSFSINCLWCHMISTRILSKSVLILLFHLFHIYSVIHYSLNPFMNTLFRLLPFTKLRNFSQNFYLPLHLKAICLGVVGILYNSAFCFIFVSVIVIPLKCF